MYEYKGKDMDMEIESAQFKRLKIKKELTKKSQERFKFLENPVEYLKNLMEKNIKKEYDEYLEDHPKKYWESEKSYKERTSQKLLELNSNAGKTYTKKWYETEAKRWSQPQYVYYNENKIEIPNNFYLDYKTPDKAAFIEYLVAQDEEKHIVTQEDREKARLLDCNLDYNYLQTLLNKMNANPDIVISIKTRDGALITIRKQEKEELEDIINKDIFVAPDIVH